jgi:DNA replication protein DnaC
VDDEHLSDNARAIKRRVEEELARRAPSPAPTQVAAPKDTDAPLVRTKATLAPDYFAAVARSMGADVETTRPEDYKPRCTCGRPMQRRNEICADCSYARRYARWQETIADSLAPAVSSFDPTGQMAWARVGDPKHAKAVQKGREAAHDMARSAERVVAARIFGEALWLPTDGNVLLLGTTGLGKTMATLAVGHRLIDTARASNPIPRSDDPAEQERARRAAEQVAYGVGARFVTADALADEGYQHPFGRGAAPLYDAAVKARLLVIDEVGRCRADTIRKLLFDRYLADGAPVVMTGSVTLSEFKAWIGMDGFRRIEERGHVIDLPRSML